MAVAVAVAVPMERGRGGEGETTKECWLQNTMQGTRTMSDGGLLEELQAGDPGVGLADSERSG